MNESKETPELLPVAYIINGIDALGRHYIREVRTPLDDEWKLDDGGLGDHWSGNEPLFRADSWKSRALTAEKERDELQEKLHAKHIEWDHAERSCSELRKHRDDWHAQALKAAQARLDAEAERDALKREVEGQARVIDRLRVDVAALRADEGRLDWLDFVNIKSNERNGTVYGWRFEQNHLRASLTDHHAPHMPVRAAIDAAIADAALAQKPI